MELTWTAIHKLWFDFTEFWGFLLSFERVLPSFTEFFEYLGFLWDLYGIDSITKGFTRDGTNLNRYS